MKKINLDQWNRKGLYLFFKDFDYPKYSITVDLDVTGYLNYIKKHQLSFYYSMIHLVLGEMRTIPNFLYRIKDQDVYLVDDIHPSFTDAIKDSDLFKIVNTSYVEDLVLFNQQAKRASDLQGDLYINLDDESRIDMVYITTFPWAKYTQLTHAYHQAKEDAIPRIAWGKFEEIQGRRMMPFSIEVHHGLVDGRHVGELIQQIQRKLDTYHS